jgi:hypothetical protein
MVTTTDKFQEIKKEYYGSVDECKKHHSIRINTNPRYGKFCQTHFTAGDDEQFEEYRSKTNGDLSNIPINMDKNVFKCMPLDNSMEWEKYKNLSSKAVRNTFDYFFNKFKKGIFVKIQDNEF